MPIAYRDDRITCDTDGVTIRFYYFPWGDKRVLYDEIREVKQLRLDRGLFAGKYRSWGSGDFRHWFNFDPLRHKKKVAFALDLGKRFIPVLTPDDPAAMRAVLEERGLQIIDSL